MKILKNVSNFLIITPENELADQLLRIEKAGRTCYQSDQNEITQETAKKFVHMLIKRGHESVLEHSCMTVQFNNLSRGFTHEQVRHRLTGISQESTRYVDYAKESGEVDLDKFELKCVVPPHKDENQIILLEDGRKLTPTQMFLEFEKFYRALRKNGWLPEDARQFLPTGLKAQIVVSANFREWRHIFFMRTSKFAHWEIRKIMCDLLEKVQKIIPGVFDDFKEVGKDKNDLRFFEKVSF
ncbi:MAG: thymidylate synthase (FAD) [Parcubacteria group bacterium Athens0714_16]|nr:MAG: thymidylate synthase (FAD) [Parcubacteria group bacterium Athens0714_16]